MGLLDGRRAVVTGGGSGIGRATCRRMAEEGARVAVFDVDEESARTVAGEIGGIAFGVDVGDPDALREAVDAAAAELGGLSIIYNNAGTAAFNKLHEMDLSDWDRVLRVNLTGVWAGIRAAVPHLLAGGGGSIVSTASISGTRPAAGESPYAASKAAVAALTASAALEYAPTIRVNAVSPGMISNPARTEKNTIVNQGVRKVGCNRENKLGSWRCSASDQDKREIPISPAFVAINKIVAASTPT